MSIKEIIQQLLVTMDDARGQESHFDSWLTQNEGICKAIDSLKILDTQPAPQPEPTGQAPCVRHCEANAFKIVIRGLKGDIERLTAQPVPVQEQLGGTREAFENWAKSLPNYMDITRFEAGYSDCNTDSAWAGWQAAQPAQEQNFCPRCGKRTADLTTIHTCTPPRENT
jgi:hypothetical protein